MRLECGHDGDHKAKGLCGTCYKRWDRWGRPAEVPPPHTRGPGRSRADRREDYAELLSWGETRQQAARRLGISERTAWRYEAELRPACVPVDVQQQERGAA